MIDYTKLRKKLSPDKGGEPPVHLRTATVGSVNGDGTVNLTMGSGAVVPNVGCLSSATVSAGNQVQVLMGVGVALVLGTVA